MKLNYRKTFFVGLAFFIISLFWQAYDTTVPKILVDKFGMNQGLSGFVMALDNILALFLLPLFGHLSDKTKTRLGRRTPYIIIGTILAAAFFVSTTFADNLQVTKLEGIENNSNLVEILDDPGLKIDTDPGIKTEYVQIKEAMEKAGVTIDEFINLKPGTGNEEEEVKFTEYVKPARVAYAWKKTVENPLPLVMFMSLLLLVLLSMSVFRSPAVALMPDVTLKPLRSKANAVINLMGAFGGITVMALGILFATDKPINTYMSYTAYFTCVAAVMIIILAVFLLKVREPRLVAQNEEELKKYGLEEKEEPVTVDIKEKLSKKKLASLLFLLGSVFLWFMGYNAVTTKYSLYAGTVLNIGYNLPLIIAQAAAVLAFIPIGIIASKIGRKKSILAGIIMLAVAFLGAYILTKLYKNLVLSKSVINILMYFVFIFAGFGWATINVNSYPMVVELSKGSNVGKYTGFYYTASMAAQVATPIISGVLMDATSMSVLFPYAAIFTLLSFVTMLVVKHGDVKPEAKKNIEAFDSGND